MTTSATRPTRQLDRTDVRHVHPPRDAPGLARRAGAEALAIFALVFAGCAAIVADARYDGALGTVGIALVFGLVIMAMVYATGHLLRRDLWPHSGGSRTKEQCCWSRATSWMRPATATTCCSCARASSSPQASRKI
jgi:hypothetical protein